MSTKITARTHPLGNTPRRTAKIIADNAVPAIQEALQLAGIAGAVYAAGVSEREDGQLEGMVHISLGAADAYDFGRWLRSRADPPVPSDHCERRQAS
ncbi:hypothetical protein Slala03_21040 [Streptomyces lavendulae subsp. lavendulae]|uniref:hypothetical protein n=1 Tax=Streptomyces lavendulae TaxID=1914 RepID=UPI0024A50B39|nr:hypothetical protein [Streptomyces lavendulae]GLV82415.1 hypothetical protein Slala03_21040 [Streptomyces lavendulae subsp. lavendulae]